MRIALVACTKRKQAQAAPARALYTSTWFTLARAYAEQRADAWYILSAQHGLVAPEQVLAPYDATLNSQWASACFARMTAPVLLEVLPAAAHVVFIAGKYYWLHLQDYLRRDGYTVEMPLRHLGIGEQMRWLKQATNDDESED
jgi:hypothetical protein